MKSLAVQDAQVLVLPPSSTNKAKGELFERFIANLLANQFGFEEPQTQNLNVTSDGIELDVKAKHKLTRGTAIAECKAFSRNVRAAELTNFYGKLIIERFEDPQAFGLMCALPRLTPEGDEKAQEITRNDNNFQYLSGNAIAAALKQAGLIVQQPPSTADTSDFTVVITESGVFAAAIVLDPVERTPLNVGMWSSEGEVPNSVIELMRASEYSTGLSVLDVGGGGPPPVSSLTPQTENVLLAQVAGSTSDFEYQLPASPKYFVGRRIAVDRLRGFLTAETGSIVVLNAQSGWGKSSLALKMQDLVRRVSGVGIVLDTRTADQPRYVVEVLRKTGTEAHAAGILELPSNASWASLDSAVATLIEAKWLETDRPLLIFFDQFENVFSNAELTRTFRDLALSCREIDGPLIVGFAWKTDLVGWTENHPYKLRDDIRSAGSVVVIDTFGPSEVTVLLKRLADQALTRLLPDLRSRLRVYSQGLPWLLKKLADHVLKELREGATQEQLLAESLNVVGLFSADLAELNPTEHEVVRHVARYAPISAREVTERFGPDPVQSLVDRRLLVQVGDRLDTYWDTFRDFLNTGRIPVQDSYILRQTPRSVARLLPLVVAAGGDISVQRLETELGTSDRAIFNLSRELRLLGVTAQEPNRVKLVEQVLASSDRESAMRRLVADSLRRHRAYSTLRTLAERNDDVVTLDSFARELPNAFPAVDVASSSWIAYARAFLFWFEYAGLVIRQGTEYSPTNEGLSTPTLRLLGQRTPLRVRAGVPYIAPRRAIELLKRLSVEVEIEMPSHAKDREALGTLVALGAVSVSVDRKCRLAVAEVVQDGQVNPGHLQQLLAGVPGGREGLAAIEANPRCSPRDVGQAIASAAHSKWTDGTTRSVGGHFRSWAKYAGLDVQTPARNQ